MKKVSTLAEAEQKNFRAEVDRRVRPGRSVRAGIGVVDESGAVVLEQRLLRPAAGGGGHRAGSNSK
jgi:hypothetical protein